MEHQRQRVAEWMPLLDAATRQFGTPSYVARWRPVASRVAELESLAPDAVRVRNWLSFKTHPVAPLVRQWLRTGRGVEVVSETEFVTARNLGASVEHLLVNGVAKHAWLPRRPLPRLRVHFDSMAEVEALLPIARQDKWRVGVRCHVPDERDARDCRYGGQFGMTTSEATEALRLLMASGVDVQGIHFHLGQRPGHPDAYVRSVDHVADVCFRAAFKPSYIDLGGGLPGAFNPDQALASLKRAIAMASGAFATLKEIWLENGRFITEASTALVVRVLDIKQREDSRYLICDGGRTNHALAADQGPHSLLLIPHRDGAPCMTTICGPTCMTDDVLARVAMPGDIAPGDVIAWLDAGAYHLPWETRFSHGLCAVVWCDADERLSLARDRERPEMWSMPWVSSAA